MMDNNKVLNRKEIKGEYKWKISDLFADDNLWKEEYEKVKKLEKKAENYKGNLHYSSEKLVEFLNFYEDISKRMERIYVYANQKYHEDTNDTNYQSLADMSSSLMVSVSEKTSFAMPEILDIEEEKLNEWIDENENLKKYNRFLKEIIRKKPHTLSMEVEELLAQAGEIAQAPDDIFSMFNNADLKFPSIFNNEGTEMELTHSRYMVFLQNQNRNIRKEAFEKLHHTYEKYQNTLAATYRANVKQEIFFSKARKYNSTLEMELDDSSIPIKVYENLVESVNENLENLHRYVSLRKKYMQLEELHMYDLYVPMVSKVSMKISFEEAKEKVLKGLEPLGEEYQNILKDGFENGWIDVYENVGKRSGAYSWGAYGTHPYVLLNYQDNLNNVFTLAHEMGHAIHSYYSDANQEYLDAGYKIFVAEVASTCNEALLMEYLLSKSKDKNEKAYLINYFLEQFRTTLYRQTMFAEFEMTTHALAEAGEALTAERMNKIYYELNVKYFGNDIVVDKEIAIEWSRIPHFYNSFYVYQYATGYSAAIALSKKILEEGEPAVEEYKKFLKGGSSKTPIELLKMGGVDLTTARPIKEALNVFNELLDEMEECLM